MNCRLIVGNINRELEAAYVWSLKEGFQKNVWQDVRTPVSKPVPDEKKYFWGYMSAIKAHCGASKKKKAFSTCSVASANS